MQQQRQMDCSRTRARRCRWWFRNLNAQTAMWVHSRGRCSRSMRPITRIFCIDPQNCRDGLWRTKVAALPLVVPEISAQTTRWVHSRGRCFQSKILNGSPARCGRRAAVGHLGMQRADVQVIMQGMGLGFVQHTTALHVFGIGISRAALRLTSRRADRQAGVNRRGDQGLRPMWKAQS